MKKSKLRQTSDDWEELLKNWEEMQSLLRENAAKDRAEGLTHTAEVCEVSALAIEACSRAVKDVLKSKNL